MDSFIGCHRRYFKGAQKHDQTYPGIIPRHPPPIIHQGKMLIQTLFIAPWSVCIGIRDVSPCRRWDFTFLYPLRNTTMSSSRPSSCAQLLESFLSHKSTPDPTRHKIYNAKRESANIAEQTATNATYDIPAAHKYKSQCLQVIAQ